MKTKTKEVLSIIIIYGIIFVTFIGLGMFLEYDLEKTSRLIKKEMTEKVIEKNKINTCYELIGNEPLGIAIQILKNCIEKDNPNIYK